MFHRLVFWLSLLIAAAAMATAWHFRRAAQALAASGIEARSEVARLTKRMNDLEQIRVREQPAKTTEKLASVAGRKSSAVEMLRESMETSAKKESEARRNELFETPSLQLLYEQSQRAINRATFAALFHQRKLTPEQQDDFIAAVVKSAMEYQDIEAIIKANGLPRNDPALKAQRERSDATLKGELEAVLGPDAMAVAREYTRLSMARSYVASCAGFLSRIGQPLAIDQIAALTTVVGHASPQQSPDPSHFTSQQWDQVWGQAQNFLTPDQWREIQSITLPDVPASRWDSATQEALTRAAGPPR